MCSATQLELPKFVAAQNTCFVVSVWLLISIDLQALQPASIAVMPQHQYDG